MRTKLVLWGNNDKDEKLLIALQLLQEENQVKIYTFPEQVATEEFYNRMMNLWRNDQTMSFPDEHTVIDRSLTASDDLLPENLKVDRPDIVTRAKSEWHFVVLSSKQAESYQQDIEDFKERIEALNEFDSGVWEELKAFWNKVQTKIVEKSLFREHANDLKLEVNTLFGQLKDLKKIENAKFSQESSERAQGFFDKLEDIRSRIDKGLGLQPIFNELKRLQGDFRNTQFTRSDQNKVWKKLDGTFKLVKKKRFGDGTNEYSAVERIKRRYNGLVSAILKMEKSIKRDRDEIEFQNRKISTTNGQLEMQIRQAKLAMIQDRISSKDEKLTEMLKTRQQLEQKMTKEQKKAEEKIAKKAAQTESQAEAKTDEAKAPDESPSKEEDKKAVASEEKAVPVSASEEE